MNTLSIPTTIRTNTVAAPVFRTIDTAMHPGRPAASWLPAPAPTRRNQVHRSIPVTRGWIAVPRQTAGEKLMLALLAGAAVAGIGYGFVCLLNLVQNWAVFHAGIATLVQ